MTCSFVKADLVDDLGEWLYTELKLAVAAIAVWFTAMVEGSGSGIYMLLGVDTGTEIVSVTGATAAWTWLWVVLWLVGPNE